jgi:WD40 repeat protein
MAQDGSTEHPQKDNRTDSQPPLHEADTLICRRDTEESWRGLLHDDLAIGDTIRPADDGSPAPTEIKVRPRGLLPYGQGNGEDAEFELRDVIGEGGMGVVYAARQTALGRDVAIKLVSPDRADRAATQDRFLSEAAITAELEHPNVVPIYDLGTDSLGTLFYAMKRIQGTPWHARMKDMSLRQNLDVLTSVADAVAFAHSRGVIHRDLKPGNVLLGGYGEVVLADWGLALHTHDVGRGSHLNDRTASGGTPAYMAPEMATCDLALIGPCSDVYLLGGILYCILTGHRPHTGRNAMDCVYRAARNEIKPIQDGGELAAIAMKALATDPRDRHPDVAAFCGAIHSYLEHQGSIQTSERADAHLAQAHTTGDYDHFAQALFGFREALTAWPANDAAGSGLAQARVAYATCALERRDYDLAESLLQDNNPDHAALLERIRADRQERDERRERLARIAYTGRLALAEKYIGLGSIQQADGILDECDPARRGWEWGHLKSICHPVGRHWQAHDGAVTGVDADARSARIVSCGQDGCVRLWDADSLKLLWETAAHDGGATGVAFSPDATRILSAGNDGAVRLWDRDTGKALAAFEGHEKRVTHIVWLEDGRSFVSAADDGCVLRWDAADGAEPTVLLRDMGVYRALVPFNRGESLYAIGHSKMDRWQISLSTEDGKVDWQHRRSPRGHHEDILFRRLGVACKGISGPITISPMGGISLGDADHRSWWVTVAGSAGQRYGCIAAISPERRRLAVGSDDSMVVMFELPDTDSTLALPAGASVDLPRIGHVAVHDDQQQCVAWLGDDVVVTGSYCGALTSWPTTGSAVRLLTGHKQFVIAACWEGPDVVWTGSHDGTLRSWDAATGEARSCIEIGSCWIYDLSLCGPDTAVLPLERGRRVEGYVQGAPDRTRDLCENRVVNLTTGETIAAVSGREANMTHHTASGRVALVTTDHAIELRRLPDMALESDWPTPHEQITGLAFSPAGDRLVTGCRTKGLVCIWDVPSGRLIRQMAAHDSGVTRAACAGHVFVTGDHGHALLWRWDADEPYAVLDIGRENTVGLALSPCGRRLVTLASGGTCKLWDVATGDELLDLSHHLETGGRAAFSPDGRRLFISTGRDHVGVVLDAGEWL